MLSEYSHVPLYIFFSPARFVREKSESDLDRDFDRGLQEIAKLPFHNMHVFGYDASLAHVAEQHGLPFTVLPYPSASDWKRQVGLSQKQIMREGIVSRGGQSCLRIIFNGGYSPEENDNSLLERLLAEHFCRGSTVHFGSFAELHFPYLLECGKGFASPVELEPVGLYFMEAKITVCSDGISMGLAESYLSSLHTLTRGKSSDPELLASLLREIETLTRQTPYLTHPALHRGTVILKSDNDPSHQPRNKSLRCYLFEDGEWSDVGIQVQNFEVLSSPDELDRWRSSTKEMRGRHLWIGLDPPQGDRLPSCPTLFSNSDILQRNLIVHCETVMDRVIAILEDNTLISSAHVAGCALVSKAGGIHMHPTFEPATSDRIYVAFFSVSGVKHSSYTYSYRNNDWLLERLETGLSTPPEVCESFVLKAVGDDIVFLSTLRGKFLMFVDYARPSSTIVDGEEVSFRSFEKNSSNSRTNGNTVAVWTGQVFLPADGGGSKWGVQDIGRLGFADAKA